MCCLPHGRCRFRIFSQAKPRGHAYTEYSMEGQSVSTVVSKLEVHSWKEGRLPLLPSILLNMLLHQVFDTMLSFAARVLGGEMPDDDATTQWAFEQIYSFVVPNVREELLIPSGSTPD